MADKVGRPGKYETHVLPKIEQIKQLASAGCTNREIAKAIGIGITSFCDYQSQYPEFSVALNEARLKGISEVKKALFKKAIGFEYEEKKTYIKRDDEGKECKYTEITKKYSAPDSSAIQMYLRNYDQTWLDRDQTSYELKRMELDLRKQLVESNNF